MSGIDLSQFTPDQIEALGKLSEKQLAAMFGTGNANNGNVSKGKRMTVSADRSALLPNRLPGNAYPGVPKGSAAEKALHKVNKLSVGESCTYAKAYVNIRQLFAGLRFQALHWNDNLGGSGKSIADETVTYHARRGVKSTSGKSYNPAALDIIIENDDSGRVTIKRVG